MHQGQGYKSCLDLVNLQKCQDNETTYCVAKSRGSHDDYNCPLTEKWVCFTGLRQYGLPNRESKCPTEAQTAVQDAVQRLKPQAPPIQLRLPTPWREPELSPRVIMLINATHVSGTTPVSMQLLALHLNSPSLHTCHSDLPYK